ncbi:MAG: carboxypeptidase-like regulatory domain-containing protein [Cyclobacteriaceae bacterium]
MRHSFLLLLLLNVVIGFSQSKNERITLSFEDEDLSVIFDSLSASTGYFFSYNSDLLPKGSRFTIAKEDLLIDQFLSELLVGTGLKYSFFKEQIIINYESPQPEVRKRKLFNVSGSIADENGLPLIGVNVFLDGTTIGTSTDIDGNYFIDKIPPGYYNLVFSYVGYENAVFNLIEYNGGSRIQRHQMVPSISLLKEVEIVSNRITVEYDEWLTYFHVFQDDLFGTSENSWHCVITNPDVINFTFDDNTGKLSAHATEPIIIMNEAMAYSITYYLEFFERTDSDLRYRGQMRFENDFRLDAFSKREIRTQRKKGYLGSWNHFKKSLLGNRLDKDGFRVYESKNVKNINVKKLKELHEGDLVAFKGKHWELDFDNYLVVVYGKEKESINFLIDGKYASVIYGDYIDNQNVLTRTPGKQVSVLKLLHGPVRLDLNGQVIDKFALSTFGYWSWERLANLVPINYEPKFDKFSK